MHRPKVYVDNSVISGTQDDEFAEESRRFFELVREGRYVVLVSEVTYDEVEDAPARARQVLRELPEDAIEEVGIDDEVRALAESYVSAGALTRRRMYDALHIAAASVAGADLVLSWNFEHMVNYDRIRKFNAVNLLNGYRPLDVRSPREVVHGHED
jgi:predicted nucleic acid-binding protein